MWIYDRSPWGRRAGWSRLGHSRSSSSASWTRRRLFPTDSRSSWVCPVGSRVSTVKQKPLVPAFHSSSDIPRNHVSSCFFGLKTTTMLPKWKPPNKQTPDALWSLPAARCCSSPRWCGRTRCRPAPPARRWPSRCTARPPRWTACRRAPWTACRCGSASPPGRPPGTAADSAAPQCTAQRETEHGHEYW